MSTIDEQRRKYQYMQVIGAFKGAVLALLVAAYFVRDTSAHIAQGLGFSACILALIPVWLRSKTQGVINGKETD